MLTARGNCFNLLKGEAKFLPQYSRNAEYYVHVERRDSSFYNFALSSFERAGLMENASTNKFRVAPPCFDYFLFLLLRSSRSFTLERKVLAKFARSEFHGISRRLRGARVFSLQVDLALSSRQLEVFLLPSSSHLWLLFIISFTPQGADAVEMLSRISADTEFFLLLCCTSPLVRYFLACCIRQ